MEFVTQNWELIIAGVVLALDLIQNAAVKKEAKKIVGYAKDKKFTEDEVRDLMADLGSAIHKRASGISWLKGWL